MVSTGVLEFVGGEVGGGFAFDVGACVGAGVLGVMLKVGACVGAGVAGVVILNVGACVGAGVVTLGIEGGGVARLDGGLDLGASF